MRWIVGLLALMVSSNAYAGPPGYCEGQHGAVTRLICADEELWTIDAEVLGEFNSWASNVAGAERRARSESHGAWIRSRNEQCGLSNMKEDAPIETLMAAKPCMLKAYQERLKYYDSVMWN
jgi:uncharacterized protein YecT (DUF1311 family)